jgi:hypothetical protein
MNAVELVHTALKLSALTALLRAPLAVLRAADMRPSPAPPILGKGVRQIFADDRKDRAVWSRSAANIEAAKKNFGADMLTTYLERGGGHRPYFIYREVLLFACKHLNLPGTASDTIRGLPLVNLGQWCDRHQIPLEKLYGTQLHWRGANAPDVNITPLPPENLAVLRQEERGTADFTLEGWLDQIEGKR